MKGRFIGYPTGWLLAVIDDSVSAAAAARSVTVSGVDEADVIVLSGAEDARRLDGLGTSSGIVERVRRATQFMTMDQMPDFLLYELAAEWGRSVVGVRTRAPIERETLLAILRGHGAHFINRFGSLTTEEIAHWSGPHPEIPHYMHR
ncbi:MAG: hypothetical protein ABI534_06160 [Chloroflexota bacterium]